MEFTINHLILGIIVIVVLIIFLIFSYIPSFENPLIKGNYIIYDVSIKDGKYSLSENIHTGREKKMIKSNEEMSVKEIIQLRQKSTENLISPGIVSDRGVYVIFYDYPDDYPMYISSKNVRIDDKKYLSYKKIRFYGKTKNIMIWQINNTYSNVFYECENYEKMGNLIKYH